jgi:hypothetical protein
MGDAQCWFSQSNTKANHCTDSGSQKIYVGAPDGLCSTHKDQINTDLLACLKG